MVHGGPLMAVDLGGEFLKVSVVKPGRTPISIVTNEMSKRRTSAQLAFIEGDRLLGEEAAALAVRYPDRVYARRAAKLISAPLDTNTRAMHCPCGCLKTVQYPCSMRVPQSGIPCRLLVYARMPWISFCGPRTIAASAERRLTHNCTSSVVP